MTRRESLRLGTLFAFGMALGKLDALKAEGGQLTADLGQWNQIVFKYHGKTIAVSTSEIFKSLVTATQKGVT